MHKVNINGIVLDKCVNNCGLWFDAEELSKFINALSDDKLSQDSTINFLGEFFNVK
ncbi:MAG: zf-TFIIB domain-containing protein [Candidatus Melainabacteria bacterium]|nr:MAG: zf-TFIIB domain-containing protein [Candidatus Melainabacteria bacterium]